MQNLNTKLVDATLYDLKILLIDVLNMQVENAGRSLRSTDITQYFVQFVELYKQIGWPLIIFVGILTAMGVIYGLMMVFNWIFSSCLKKKAQDLPILDLMKEVEKQGHNKFQELQTLVNNFINPNAQQDVIKTKSGELKTVKKTNSELPTIEEIYEEEKKPDGKVKKLIKGIGNKISDTLKPKINFEIKKNNKGENIIEFPKNESDDETI